MALISHFDLKAKYLSIAHPHTASLSSPSAALLLLDVSCPDLSLVITAPCTALENNEHMALI
jgi:hypothetical protein